MFTHGTQIFFFFTIVELPPEIFTCGLDTFAVLQVNNFQNLIIIKDRSHFINTFHLFIINGHNSLFFRKKSHVYIKKV